MILEISSNPADNPADTITIIEHIIEIIKYIMTDKDFDPPTE